MEFALPQHSQKTVLQHNPWDEEIVQMILILRRLSVLDACQAFADFLNRLNREHAEQMAGKVDALMTS